jgi:hypothetical protein
MALDSRGLHGPDVDPACGTWVGNPDGDVEAWENADAVPSPAQLVALAELTRYPIAWFYRPLPAGPLLGGPVHVCFTNRRKSVVLAPDVVDERGVLLCEGQPREKPNPQGALF